MTNHPGHPGNQNRQPKGIPTGGQFAASARTEADAVALGDRFPDPTGPADTLLDGSQRHDHARTLLIGAGQARRSDDTPDGSGYFGGIAQVDAEAFWLLQRDTVPPPHEVAWHADEFVTGNLDPAIGSMPTHQAQREFVGNLGPYQPMSHEHATAVSDHFLVRALSIADRLATSGPAPNRQPTFEDGALHAACLNAIRFRRGNDPDPHEAASLATAIRERAATRADLPTGYVPEPTVEDAHEVYGETFDPYWGASEEDLADLASLGY